MASNRTARRPIAPISHRRPSSLDRFYFGAAYYPEHWDRQTRRDDAQRMADAGFNVVRLAEFAWDSLEPRPGEFDFSFFDAAIDELAKHNIDVILCTPTASPPRWLTRNHPELLRVDVNGVVQQHGSRQHACTTNTLFREYSRRITSAMANHFRHHPTAVGWQTDNEFHCHFSECHCPACQTAFAEFLRTKYGTIDALNRAWGSVFWAQTYADFADVPTAKPMKPTYPNPSHEIDYHRFLSAATTTFQREQIEILRAANADWFITHNSVLHNIDCRGDFVRDLDIFGYDSYPCFASLGERRTNHAFQLDYVRGLAGNFIIPELQSGPGGQANYLHETLEPGEIRRITMTCLAHGADSILYFRWRSCRFGAEEYWCGILDHDNVPRRRFDEVKRIGSELKALAPALLGTHVAIDAAIASGDFTNDWAHASLNFSLPDPGKITKGIHRFLHTNHIAVGCLHPDDDLTGVKVYVLPHWVIVTPTVAEKLRAYVEAGGVLVVGARSATRTIDNTVIAETIPGVLRPLVGATVREYTRQNEPSVRTRSIDIDGSPIATEHWAEILDADADTDVVARWQGRHYTGEAAVTRRRVDRGCVFYVGTYLTEPVFAALWPKLQAESHVGPILPNLPSDIEITRRIAKDRELLFVISHSETPHTLTNLPVGTNLLTGQPIGGTTTLKPNDVLIIRR